MSSHSVKHTHLPKASLTWEAFANVVGRNRGRQGRRWKVTGERPEEGKKRQGLARALRVLRAEPRPHSNTYKPEPQPVQSRAAHDRYPTQPSHPRPERNAAAAHSHTPARIGRCAVFGRLGCLGAVKAAKRRIERTFLGSF